MARWLIIGALVTLLLIMAIVVFGRSEQHGPIGELSDDVFIIRGEGAYDEFVRIPNELACRYHNAIFEFELLEELPISDMPDFPLRVTLGALRGTSHSMQHHRVIEGVTIVNESGELISAHTIPLSDYWDVPIDYHPVRHEGESGYWIAVNYAGAAPTRFTWALSFEPVRPSDKAGCG